MREVEDVNHLDDVPEFDPAQEEFDENLDLGETLDDQDDDPRLVPHPDEEPPPLEEHKGHEWSGGEQ